ncbi:MFS general substrate transporter [Linderina pennispora]|uniref:MFS general substrate transporter n=1 Tax=Linderina pennispora TaxID=61395 RepID=A0A1Y1W4T6_9FUNG|nr:MFS general substrate transporter [Linderina pennispora]ORX68531.1 MFS general substrate transporter [Linderina pennispora]
MNSSAVMDESFDINEKILESMAESQDNIADEKGNMSTSESGLGSTQPVAKWWESNKHGWFVVISGCLMMMFSMGCVNSYGSYQTYYHAHQFPEEPTSTLAWIGTLQFAVMNAVGIPAGILCERVDSRLVSFVGGVIMGVSFIIASFCDTAVWKLMLTQGIVFSIGASLVFIPAVSFPSQWFVKYRPLAVGIVPTNSMIDRLGSGWALRISGIIIIAVCSVCSIFMRNRLKLESREKVVDFSVLHDVRFLFIFAGAIFSTTGYFTPFFDMPMYAFKVVDMDASLAKNLVTIINAASTAGRVVTGQIAVIVGNINALLVCMFVAALSLLVLWLPFEATGTTLACSIIYGFFCGGFISLLPVIIADLWGVSRIATIIGLLYIATFMGTMIGAPSSSAILDNIGHGTNFRPTIAFSGCFMAASFLAFCGLRIATNRKLLKKV